MNKTLLISLVLALHTSLAIGQVKPGPSDAWQSVFFDSPAKALPILTEAAMKHSGAIKALEIDKALEQENIKLAKKVILNSFGVNAGYTYGNQIGFGVANAGDPNQFRTFNASRYQAGVNFALPLGQVVSRGNQIKREQLNYQRAEALRQERELLLHQQIITLYQNVLLARKVLTLQQEAFVNTRTNYQLAEKQFRQGQVTLQELSGANSQLTAVSVAQESARSQYDTTFMLLEEVVGEKIPSLMTAR